jgi:vacuolar-type H+-ATPase subunit E/Vma4
MTRRNRTAALYAACAFLPCLSYARMHWTPENDPAGGGGGDKKGDKGEQGDKITLTAAELQAKIEAAAADAVNRANEAAADKARKDKEAADAETARKNGEFEKLAEAEREKREAAERRAQLAEVNVALRDHLADKHPDYLANAPDIMLHVEKHLAADAKPADVKKLIEEQSKAFADRTPRKVAAGGGVSASPRNGLPAGTDVKKKANGQQQHQAMAGVAASQF